MAEFSTYEDLLRAFQAEFFPMDAPLATIDEKISALKEKMMKLDASRLARVKKQLARRELNKK